MGTVKFAVLPALFMFAVLAASVFAAPGGMFGLKLAGGNDEGKGAGIGTGIQKNTATQNAGAEGQVMAQIRERYVEKGHYLDTRYAHLACRIDFTTTVIDNVVDAVPKTASALSGHSATLKDDNVKLGELAADGDPNAFNSFVSGTLRPDMTGAIKALAQERRNYRSYNISNDTIAQLRADYAAAHETLKECEEGAVIKLGEARIRHYNSIIDGWQATRDHLGEKGVSTAAMNGVIGGAQNNVVSPLQSAVDSGDPETVKSALRTYCLGNGCNGNGGEPYNYHGFAMINLERMQAIKDKLAETSDSSVLEDVQSKLDVARDMLAQVGTAKYADGQSETIWDSLRDSARMLKDYLHSLRPATAAAGQVPPTAPAESQ